MWFLRNYFLQDAEGDESPLPPQINAPRKESKKGALEDNPQQMPLRFMTGGNRTFESGAQNNGVHLGEYLDAACLDAWNIVQDEFVQIIAEMLNVPLQQASCLSITSHRYRAHNLI